MTTPAPKLQDYDILLDVNTVEQVTELVAKICAGLLVSLFAANELLEEIKRFRQTKRTV